MLREEPEQSGGRVTIGSRPIGQDAGGAGGKKGKAKLSKSKKRMLAFARKNRTYWRTRVSYIVANIVMLVLVYTTGHTSLWRTNRTTQTQELVTEHIITQLLFVLFSWVAYFLVQGSDPGSVSDEMTPDEAVEFSSDAIRGDPWDDDEFLGDGTEDIDAAKRHFEDIESGDADEGGKQGDGGARADEVEFDMSFPTMDEEGDALIPRVETKHPKFPYRTIYCRQTRRWVATYDHYCGMLSTPIGEKNHARFWLFLQMQTVTLCWAIGIVHSGFRIFTGDKGWWEVNAHAFFTVLILYILLAFVGGLYLFHSFLACSCITTYEFMRSDRIDYLKGTRDFDLPYSRGLGGNLKFFFFQDGLLYIIFNRKWKPENWKLPGKIIRDGDWHENIWENKYWSCC